MPCYCLCTDAPHITCTCTILFPFDVKSSCSNRFIRYDDFSQICTLSKLYILLYKISRELNLVPSERQLNSDFVLVRRTCRSKNLTFVFDNSLISAVCETFFSLSLGYRILFSATLFYVSIDFVVTKSFLWPPTFNWGVCSTGLMQKARRPTAPCNNVRQWDPMSLLMRV